MLILLPVCRNLLSAIRGSFQVRNSVTVGSYMHVYLYGKRILILLICMLFRSWGAFCCPNVWNLWIIPSFEVCYSDLQGLFYKILFFWFRLFEKTNVGAHYCYCPFGVFLTFLSISLNFKLRTYLFNRHFTWLIILFSKLTKNIFYFNKFFLSKFESNLKGSTFS